MLSKHPPFQGHLQHLCPVEGLHNTMLPSIVQYAVDDRMKTNITRGMLIDLVDVGDVVDAWACNKEPPLIPKKERQRNQYQCSQENYKSSNSQSKDGNLPSTFCPGVLFE